MLNLPPRRNPAAEPQKLSLFPLNAVLFPGGTLGLRVFEQRYMTLVKDCFKRESAFGICLIAEGAEVGAPAQPHPVGTEARIVAWDMTQPGILNITVRGEGRFRILSSEADREGLLQARVEAIAAEADMPVPEALAAALLPLLQAMVADAGAERLPPPHRFEDAAWVGYRFCELLPIPPIARQKLLELEEPISRLEIVFKFLAQRGLVK
ncbi:MAG: LON peptidase substrate-binding domain-containing protein [Rhodocyclales bacterium]|nr:LON peptidase substrate-binding domain-containing protein [Rhodocyclales bacterium]